MLRQTKVGAAQNGIWSIINDKSSAWGDFLFGWNPHNIPWFIDFIRQEEHRRKGSGMSFFFCSGAGWIKGGSVLVCDWWFRPEYDLGINLVAFLLNFIFFSYLRQPKRTETSHVMKEIPHPQQWNAILFRTVDADRFSCLAINFCRRPPLRVACLISQIFHWLRSFGPLQINLAALTPSSKTLYTA